MEAPSLEGLAAQQTAGTVSHSSAKLERVIIHFDMDCFYCQVESVRLEIPPEIPLAVQQWNTVIAVNYAARAAGVQRHAPLQACLQQCPTLRLVHVPTYSTTQPGILTTYSDTGSSNTSTPDRNTRKVSLQPYRQASARVFTTIRETLMGLGGGFVMERASVDEVFIDVSDIVDHQMAISYGVEIQRGRLVNFNEMNFNDIASSLSWSECGKPAVDLPAHGVDEQTNDKIINVRIHLGAQIAKTVRRAVYEALRYTISAGIATNKTLAKLASATHKPNEQTYVLPTMISEWMKKVPFRKIRFMGGKLGYRLLETLRKRQSSAMDDGASDDGQEEEYLDEDLDQNHDERDGEPQSSEEQIIMAADLWNLSVEELERRLGDLESAKWAYGVIRGLDSRPVTPRLQTKSFMCAKNMRTPLKEWSQLREWLVLLLSELSARLQEDFLVNRRWPQSLTLYFKRPHEKSKSKVMDLPFEHDQLSNPSQILALADLCINVLSIDCKNTPVFPCLRLAISASRLHNVSEAATRKKTTTLDSFIKSSMARHQETKNETNTIKPKKSGGLDSLFKSKVRDDLRSETDIFQCPRCKQKFHASDDVSIAEHQDYHFAMDLQRELDTQPAS